MMQNTRLVGRDYLVLLLGMVLLGLAGCAQVGGDASVKKRGPTLVYPEAPDEPRFFYEWPIYGSTSIEAKTEDQKFQELLTGSSDFSGEGFGKPYAVAVHRGRVFVTDTVSRRVRAFDVPSGKYFAIGSSDEEDVKARLSKPMGLDVDADGNIYVADITDKSIKVYTRDGKHLRNLAGPEFFDKLTSVAVDSNGERIYAVDIGGPSTQNHRVRVFNAKTGEHLFDFGKRGSAPGEFNLPRDVAIGKNGDLYVVDGGNFRIQIFDHDGKFLRTFGSIGKQQGNFARPKEIALDAEDNLYVIDSAFGNFQIFNPSGELLMFIGQRSNQDGPGLYMLSSGITVDEDGRIYVVDQWFKKVDIFRPAALPADKGYTVRSKVKK